MHHEPHAESTTRLLDGADIRALSTHLLQVCTVFAATAEHGADIRDYGLTPELLTACQRALAVWHVQCHSSGYTGSPSLLMMQVSRCIQHSSTQQIELRTAIADALDDFQSIHLSFELAIRPRLF